MARLTVEDSSVCFVNVHLAAGQKSKSSRNADVAAILEVDKPVLDAGESLNSYINGGDGSVVMDHETVILYGDMNVRTLLSGRDEVARSDAALSHYSTGSTSAGMSCWRRSAKGTSDFFLSMINCARSVAITQRFD